MQNRTQSRPAAGMARAKTINQTLTKDTTMNKLLAALIAGAFAFVTASAVAQGDKTVTPTTPEEQAKMKADREAAKAAKGKMTAEEKKAARKASGAEKQKEAKEAEKGQKAQ